MKYLNIEDFKNKIEKLQKIRANQLKANKKYYEKNVKEITVNKKAEGFRIKTTM